MKFLCPEGYFTIGIGFNVNGLNVIIIVLINVYN